MRSRVQSQSSMHELSRLTERAGLDDEHFLLIVGSYASFDGGVESLDVTGQLGRGVLFSFLDV